MERERRGEREAGRERGRDCVCMRETYIMCLCNIYDVSVYVTQVINITVVRYDLFSSDIVVLVLHRDICLFCRVSLRLGYTLVQGLTILSFPRGSRKWTFY